MQAQVLKDKVAIITGGAGGIGKATAKLFLAEGAKVLLVDLKEDALQKAQQELGATANLAYAVADVSKSQDVKHYVQIAQDKFGQIDVFFDNAGIEGVVKSITDYPEEEFDKVLAVNLKGVWLGLKYVMPVMQKQGGGSIIITSSVAGVKGFAEMVAYTTSKHGLIGMMRVAAQEGAQYKIRVNTVNPAPVDTRMMRSLEQGFAQQQGTSDQVKKGFEQSIPLKRYATPEEIGKVVLFLASDQSSFVTGAVHLVDGGMMA